MLPFTTVAAMARPKLAAPTKQIGIRIPLAIWNRTKVIAASKGKRPGEYIASVLVAALPKEEVALIAKLAGGK